MNWKIDSGNLYVSIGLNPDLPTITYSPFNILFLLLSTKRESSKGSSKKTHLSAIYYKQIKTFRIKRKYFLIFYKITSYFKK